MYNVLQTPIFGIVVSILFFSMGVYIQKKTNLAICNPLLIAILGIIIFLKVSHISYESYKIGGDTINFFLSPVTIVLAVPLYKQYDLLKKHLHEIVIGITSGVLVSFISILIITKITNSDKLIMDSLLGKSITTPMGISLTSTLGGIESVTIVAIILTGIVGGMIATPIFKFINTKHPVSKGIALGTASHALGTTKALELGEIEGAMSGLAIGISGTITVILIPILINFLN
ncbi:LrgB family protein [Paraclostridium ghonii]|uniref:Effector of murein hydrolase n=1 Tax=Paraclostridium ghonii TaxID=29358 RepID=A0ABU0MYY5_9FIRM|nr:LrgB family protein [Paeniclostridium ghonii]MDQ0556076.1 putative effector of murein hydrolase [Paeniclostridium ghonii]